MMIFPNNAAQLDGVDASIFVVGVVFVLALRDCEGVAQTPIHVDTIPAAFLPFLCLASHVSGCSVCLPVHGRARGDV